MTAWCDMEWRLRTVGWGGGGGMERAIGEGAGMREDGPTRVGAEMMKEGRRR